MPETLARLQQRFGAALLDAAAPSDRLFRVPDAHTAARVALYRGNLAANCYVEQPVAPEPGRLRIVEHVDFSTLTLLYQDDGPGGLQVRRRDGTWVDVPHVPGGYVVNVGDVLEVAILKVEKERNRISLGWPEE